MLTHIKIFLFLAHLLLILAPPCLSKYYLINYINWITIIMGPFFFVLDETQCFFIRSTNEVFEMKNVSWFVIRIYTFFGLNGVASYSKKFFWGFSRMKNNFFFVSISSFKYQLRIWKLQENFYKTKTGNTDFQRTMKSMSRSTIVKYETINYHLKYWTIDLGYKILLICVQR